MTALLADIYRTGKVQDESGNEYNAFPTSIPNEMNVMIDSIMGSVKPKRTLEIGVAFGLSALRFCQAHKDHTGGRHTAIDPFQSRDYKSIGVANIKRANLSEYFRFLEMNASNALPMLIRDKEKFDLVFIDGCHLFDFAFLDFYYADLLLPTGGYIILDDTWMPSIQRVLNFMVKNRGYKIVWPFSPTVPSFFTRMRTTISTLGRCFRQRKMPLRSPLDRYYGMGAGVRWCTLQKCSEDTRVWDHYVPF